MYIYPPHTHTNLLYLYMHAVLLNMNFLFNSYNEYYYCVFVSILFNDILEVYLYILFGYNTVFV